MRNMHNPAHPGETRRDDVHRRWGFFCAGAGGPESYSGKDMRATHRGMNINEQEFVTVLDDVMAAMESKAHQPEQPADRDLPVESLDAALPFTVSTRTPQGEQSAYWRGKRGPGT